jgi:hypothetical protein
MVLAASLIILTALVSFTTEHVSNLQKEQSISLGRESITRLTREIDSTFLSGPNHVKEIILSFPNGIDSSLSSIQNNSLILRVYDTDISSSAVTAIQGVFPTTAGQHRIRIHSYSDHVVISLVSLLSDQDVLYIPMSRDSNVNKSITFTNYNTSSVSADYNLSWSHTLVGVSISPAAHVFSSGEQSSATLTFSATGSALGNYVGYLYVNSTDGSTSEQLIIPLNVEVFAAPQSLMNVLPSSLEFSAMANDANTQTISICNSGSTPIKSITFTPSTQDAGAWITSIPSIAQLDGSSCQNVDITLTVPSGTSTGGYSGTISVNDYTGANSTVMSILANVTAMKDYFNWDWSTTTSTGNILSDFGLENTSVSQFIYIDQLQLRGWSACDLDSTTVANVSINDKLVYANGSAADRETFDIADAELTQGIITNNYIEFSEKITDENEQIQPIVTFTDGSVYTGSVYGSGCPDDTVEPGIPASFTSAPGSSAESVLLTFTFPGDDNHTGTVSSVVIRRSDRSITTQSDFDAATDIPFTGTILADGNIGAQLVSDLNVGYTYNFSIQFVDEANNMSALPTQVSERPWTSYNYSLGDFNIAPFAESRFSPSTGQFDINNFRLQNFVVGSGDRNVNIRITDDVNTSNNWYAAMYFGTTTEYTHVRVWYPSSASPSIPTGTPQYEGDVNISIGGNGIGMLTAGAFPTTYRFNGSSVYFPNPTHLYVDVLQGFSDMNIKWDGKIQ